MDNVKYITDLVGDNYRRWSNERIIFDAGTGSGKTTFCIEILGTYAQSQGKKIQYICNRTKLREQVYDDVRFLGLLDTIYVTSYQSIQSRILEGEEIPDYDYVLADEVHYFTSDADFNEYTDLAFHYIQSLSDTVVIYMSATATKLFEHLIAEGFVKEENVYRIEKDYGYVEQVFFYKGQELPGILDGLLAEDQDTKILVFCNSARRMQEMHDRYKDAGFYCSQHTQNSQLRKICKSDLIHDGTFGTRILFATTALDNGVNITDQRVRYVFTELVDFDKLVQSLGRRRQQGSEDRVIFYIRDYSNADLNRYLNLAKRGMKEAEWCIEDRQAFFAAHGRDTRLANRNSLFNWVSDSNDGSGKLEVNRMMLAKRRMDIAMYQSMMTVGFRRYVTKRIDFADRVYTAETTGNDKDQLLEYLRSIEGQRIYVTSEKMDEITKEFEKAAKIRYKKRPFNAYNGIIADLFPKYTCRFVRRVDKRRRLEDGSENKNRNKRYWVLEETE